MVGGGGPGSAHKLAPTVMTAVGITPRGDLQRAASLARNSRVAPARGTAGMPPGTAVFLHCLPSSVLTAAGGGSGHVALTRESKGRR